MILPYKDFYPEIDETAFVAEDAVISGDVKIGKTQASGIKR